MPSKDVSVLYSLNHLTITAACTRLTTAHHSEWYGLRYRKNLKIVHNFLNKKGLRRIAQRILNHTRDDYRIASWSQTGMMEGLSHEGKINVNESVKSYNRQYGFLA